jgi:hypothetical protein
MVQFFRENTAYNITYHGYAALRPNRSQSGGEFGKRRLRIRGAMLVRQDKLGISVEVKLTWNQV